MSLFSNNQDNSKKTPIKTTKKAPTFISKEMEVTGNFKGQGAVQVEGILHGNITVNSVVISESGVVNGIIEAKNVIINGKLKGSIKCESLEIMQSGSVSNKVEVKRLKVTGKVEGDISVFGLLDVARTGYINGAVTLKTLKIDEGGQILGSIKEYKEEPKVQEKEATPAQEPKESKKPQATETRDGKKPHQKRKKG